MSKAHGCWELLARRAVGNQVSKADADATVQYGGQRVADSERSEEVRFVQRLARRDERAFNELVMAYEQRVFGLVYRMLGRREEAEDLVQEVFVQVFKSIDGFRGDSKLGTWIYRIAINLCKNRSKYLSRRRTDAQDELQEASQGGALTAARGVTSGESSGPDQVVQGYQLEEIMKCCIAELEEEFREVLVLRDVEELTYEEIMEITGLPEGTVKSRIHRARSALKQKVAQRLGEHVG